MGTQSVLKSAHADDEEDALLPKDEYAILLRNEEIGIISGLKWQGGKQLIERVEIGPDRYRVYVYLRGRYPKKTWSFTWNTRKVKRDRKGTFLVKLPLTDQKTRFEFIAISPRGIIERESVVIFVPKWNKIHARPELKIKRHFLTPGLGATFINFSDDRSTDYAFTEYAITGKAFYRYLLWPPSWDIGISSFLTLLPLHTGGPESIRFFGFNARIGYNIPTILPPWKVSLFAGTYYSNMFSASNEFGYKNVGGPQVFPMIQRGLKKGRSLLFYAKFSPVSNRFQFLSLENREIAVGGGYASKLRNGNDLLVTFDYADLALVLEGVQITVQSATIGLAYGF